MRPDALCRANRRRVLSKQQGRSERGTLHTANHGDAGPDDDRACRDGATHHRSRPGTGRGSGLLPAELFGGAPTSVLLAAQPALPTVARRPAAALATQSAAAAAQYDDVDAWAEEAERTAFAMAAAVEAANAKAVLVSRRAAFYKRKKAEQHIVEVLLAGASEERPRIVGLGDASFLCNSAAANSPPASTRGVISLLRRDPRAILFIVDEFRTSSVCPECLCPKAYQVGDRPSTERQIPRLRRKRRNDAPGGKTWTTGDVHFCPNPCCHRTFLSHDDVGATCILLVCVVMVLTAMRKTPRAFAREDDAVSHVYGYATLSTD